ncbi:hypothetical protein [Algoriphagus algorifonticola]|uniref:hypothetical protein n=1 Tax=Algoriphagus algorifonticola TaxID=2593007 RepID=UPI0011A7318D|nr:hypothetical protein [Algoriphagus algorifonticola]
MDYINLKNAFIIFIWNFMTLVLNQDYNKFKRELDSIYFRIEESLPEEDEIEYLQDDAEDLLSDLKYFLKRNEDLSGTERSRLLELEEEIEILISFLNVIDKTNGQLEKVDFYRIIEKIGSEVSSIPSGKSCAQILKIQIGEYEALFFENLTNSISYKVTYEFLDKRYNLVAQSGEMGLIRGNIRHIANSREDENFDRLRFKSLSCEEIDFSF